VQPDVKVKAADALATAQKLAQDKLKAKQAVRDQLAPVTVVTVETSPFHSSTPAQGF